VQNTSELSRNHVPVYRLLSSGRWIFFNNPVVRRLLKKVTSNYMRFLVTLNWRRPFVTTNVGVAYPPRRERCLFDYSMSTNVTFSFSTHGYSVRERSLRHAWVETMNRHTHMVNHSKREGRRWFPERRRSMIVTPLSCRSDFSMLRYKPIGPTAYLDSCRKVE
jgi:hypothetical protein